MTRSDQAMTVVKSVGVVTPGAATLLADWLGIISTGMTILLTVLSIAFLIWRWRVAAKEMKERRK